MRTNIINPLISRGAVALECGPVATTRGAARLWAAIVVTLLTAGRPAAVNAQAQAAAPLYVPGVNYLLPSVVVTAEEIEATKKEMLANKTIDVAIRMAETGGPRVGSAWCIASKAQATHRSCTTTCRRCTRFSKAQGPW